MGDLLHNSAEIIWPCNPLFFKLGPLTAQTMVLWSDFEKHSAPDYLTRFPSRSPFQPLSCCHFPVLCIAFFYRKDCDLFKAQQLFSQKCTLSVFCFAASWNGSSAKNCQQSYGLCMRWLFGRLWLLIIISMPSGKTVSFDAS